MKNLFKLLSSIFFILCIVSFSANAQKKKISLQGFLKDANGKAVADGMQKLVFKIYTSGTGNTVIWSDTINTMVSGGVYAVQLGSRTVFSSDMSWIAPYFVGVTVQGVELIPRTELTYSPFSLSTANATTADTAKFVRCSGALGDIKYSILNPTQFASVNGACWVPMDGRSMVGSTLATKIGGTNVPNGSGLFLRGQEFPNGIDNDNSRDSNAPIGTFQDQATQTHQHGFSGNTSSNYATVHNNVVYFYDVTTTTAALRDPLTTNSQSFKEGDGGLDLFFVFNKIDVSGLHNHSFTGVTDNNNGSSSPETRPKNLNFWTYIRIN